MKAYWSQAIILHLTFTGHCMAALAFPIGVNTGAGGRDPPDFGLGVVGGHEKLFYLIIYRKYIQKLTLFNRNRIICAKCNNVKNI